MAISDRYHRDVVWLSCIVEWARQYTNSAVLAGLLTTGWVPVIATAIAIDPAETDELFLVGQVLSYSTITTGPLDV